MCGARCRASGNRHASKLQVGQTAERSLGIDRVKSRKYCEDNWLQAAQQPQSGCGEDKGREASDDAKQAAADQGYEPRPGT